MTTSVKTTTTKVQKAEAAYKTAKEKMIKAELKLAQAKEGSKKTTEEPKSDSQVWFVVFGCGDTRSDYYGWSCYWKDEMSRKDANKAGTRSADRMGERNFNYYYCKHTTYVTDSFSAFLKKCEKVGINPSKECLAEYGF